MKKIYSFVLMAAMLLIGTNSWADNQFSFGGQNYDNLQSAITAAVEASGAQQTITVNQAIEPLNYQVTLDAANKHIILDLNGNDLEFTYNTGTTIAAIILKHGVLEITGNGEISCDQTNIYDLIRVFGTTDLINPTSAPYSHLIIRPNVTVQNKKFNALTVTQNADHLANGVLVEIEGNLIGKKYGIKVNGDVRDPLYLSQPEANRAYVPYIHIKSTARVSTLDNSTNAVAAYSSGYAHWLIEGYCGGSTGLYVKSGDVVLNDAVITSTNNNPKEPTGKGSGVDAGGSAIVIESNSAYSGNMTVTIKGNTEVSAPVGYAIEETITTAPTSEVDLIKIEGGVISGGELGAIIIEDNTAKNGNQASGKVVIVGGNITSDSNTGDIVVDYDSDQGAQDEEGPRELHEITVSALNGYVSFTDEDSEATAAVVTVDGKDVIVFVPTSNDPYQVTLNDEYLATFSAPKAVTIPAGLKAYGAGDIVNNELALTTISDGTSAVNIPAGTPVILYNANQNQKEYPLEVTSSTDLFNPQSITNNLKPAVAWLASYAGSAYILHGSELYLYTGIKMKANKAFLPIVVDPQSPAPQRIRMVFHEAEQATAIENTADEAVKVTKFVKDGQIVIRRGEELYNLQGQLVK